MKEKRRLLFFKVSSLVGSSFLVTSFLTQNIVYSVNFNLGNTFYFFSNIIKKVCCCFDQNERIDPDDCNEAGNFDGVRAIKRRLYKKYGDKIELPIEHPVNNYGVIHFGSGYDVLIRVYKGLYEDFDVGGFGIDISFAVTDGQDAVWDWNGGTVSSFSLDGVFLVFDEKPEEICTAEKNFDEWYKEVSETLRLIKKLKTTGKFRVTYVKEGAKLVVKPENSLSLRVMLGLQQCSLKRLIFSFASNTLRVETSEGYNFGWFKNSSSSYYFRRGDDEQRERKALFDSLLFQVKQEGAVDISKMFDDVNNKEKLIP